MHVIVATGLGGFTMMLLYTTTFLLVASSTLSKSLYYMLVAELAQLLVDTINYTGVCSCINAVHSVSVANDNHHICQPELCAYHHTCAPSLIFASNLLKGNCIVLRTLAFCRERRESAAGHRGNFMWRAKKPLCNNFTCKV